jgi:ring-1,2-phenylacetyl-CoA epoxidase subunit PaaD
VVTLAVAEVRRIAGAVTDPELPPLTLEDLGILRDVALADGGRIVVHVTPTYSGCPATDVIAGDVRDALSRAGFEDVEVRLQLAPAWSSDDVTEEGRRKLRALGVAPPPRCGSPAAPAARPVRISVRCVRCGSRDTELLSRFSSTPCKALYRCRACTEPFEQFKAI